MKKLLMIIILALFTMSLWARWSRALAETSLFGIEAVDTMKYSRDAARNPEANKLIPAMVNAAASLNPTHIAVATPYDDEFIPVMKLWVNEIRKHNINVWYRGNFSAWEAWFGYERFADPYEHIAKTERFITNNPDLFQDGDIFTPVPEAENGGFGDPRQSEEIRHKFFDFLPKSYDSCVQSMKTIGRNVECGYFSVNGDVAHMFTKEDVDRTGGVLVIDHYVETPEELVEDIKEYNRKTGAKVVLGEYGAPIPDIHGDLSEDEQDELIKQNLIALAQIRELIGGINYWTAFGGSTEIFKEGTQPKKAVKTLASYFDPIVINGNVQDEFGGAVSGATVTNGLTSAETDSVGNYTLLATPDFLDVTVTKENFQDNSITIKPREGENRYTQNVALTAAKHDIWYQVRRVVHGLKTFTLY